MMENTFLLILYFFFLSGQISALDCNNCGTGKECMFSIFVVKAILKRLFDIWVQVLINNI